jgi:hypothetical protein
MHIKIGDFVTLLDGTCILVLQVYSQDHEVAVVDVRAAADEHSPWYYAILVKGNLAQIRRNEEIIFRKEA